MLWLIFHFLKVFLKKLQIQKVQLMLEEYFLDFCFQKFFTKVDKKSLIE